MKRKNYTLLITQQTTVGGPTTKKEVKGTLEELKEHFSYTLERAKERDGRVSSNPTTIKAFINALNCGFDVQYMNRYGFRYAQLKNN